MIACLSAIGLFGAIAHPANAASLIHNYRINGSLADSLGGPSLVSGGGTVGPTAYTFGLDQGPMLSNAITADNYSIEIVFTFNQVGGYRKIIDFADLSADAGLYNLNSYLDFYPVTAGPGPVITAGTPVHVVLTRDSSTGTVTGYVGGTQQFSFTDSSNYAVFSGTNNIIHFFQDDNTTGQREASDGSVDFIRIYDGPLSSGDVAALSNTDVLAPPAGLTATAGSQRVTLNWTASSEATSYRVARSTVSGGPFTTVASVVSTTWTNAGLTNGTTYYYEVAAVDPGSQSAPSAQASATPFLATPTGLTATAGDSKVTLVWNAVNGVIGYRVRRGTVSGGPYTTVGSVTTSKWANTGLTNGTTYYYVVASMSSTGDSPNSNEANATPFPVPPVPTGLTATPASGKVTLMWNASSGATSYRVRRSTVSGGPYTTVASLTGTTWANVGLSNGTTYYYVVAATNAAGDSANSPEVSATPN
jgi:fibronectin type 3 domain-containing protein